MGSSYNKEFTPFKINLGDINFNKKLEIVYFINSDLNNSFFKLFKDQLKDLIRSKICRYKFIKVYLVIICSSFSKRAKINEIINSLKLNNFLILIYISVKIHIKNMKVLIKFGKFLKMMKKN